MRTENGIYFWITSNGEAIEPQNMSDTHLANALRYAKKQIDKGNSVINADTDDIAYRKLTLSDFIADMEDSIFD